MNAQRRGSVSATPVSAVISVVVVAGLIVALVAFSQLTRPAPRLPEPLDYCGVLAQVREQFPYPVLAPPALPEGWRAISTHRAADERGHRWRIGFLTADTGYVGLAQSDGETASYLADRLDEFRPDGTASVDGQQWRRYVEEDRSPDRALVLRDSGVVTIVRGTEPYDELERFAARLRS